MNSLRSNSISFFVAWLKIEPRLNIDSKNLHASKDLFVRNVFERSEKTFAPCGNGYAPKGDQLRVVAETMARPLGHRLCAPYQNIYGEGLPSE